MSAEPDGGAPLSEPTPIDHTIAMLRAHIVYGVPDPDRRAAMGVLIDQIVRATAGCWTARADLDAARRALDIAHAALYEIEINATVPPFKHQADFQIEQTRLVAGAALGALGARGGAGGEDG